MDGWVVRCIPTPDHLARCLPGWMDLSVLCLDLFPSGRVVGWSDSQISAFKVGCPDLRPGIKSG